MSPLRNLAASGPLIRRNALESDVIPVIEIVFIEAFDRENQINPHKSVNSNQ